MADPCKEFNHIQLFVCHTLQSTVVEVKAINIDCGLHSVRSVEMKNRHYRRFFRPKAKWSNHKIQRIN